MLILKNFPQTPVSDLCIRAIVEDYLLYRGYGLTYNELLTDAVERGRRNDYTQLALNPSVCNNRGMPHS